MPFRKVLLRDDDCCPIAALTIRGEQSRLEIPAALRVDAYESERIFFPAPQDEIVVTTDRFSLLGELKGVRVFASTLPPEEARLAKWRLMRAWEGPQAEKVPTSPLKDTEDKVPEESRLADDERSDEPTIPEEAMIDKPPFPTEATVETDHIPSSEEIETIRPPETALTRARRLLSTGEPFHLFEEMMPQSEWAMIREDDYEYLIGITEDEHVLYGIPGSRAYPPDDESLWTFFPTDDGEEGWFLREGEIV